MMSKKASLIMSLIGTICLVLLFSISAFLPEDADYKEHSNEDKYLSDNAVCSIVSPSEYDIVVSHMEEPYISDGEVLLCQTM